MVSLNGNYDMRHLENAGLLGVRKDQAVTFVVNHDTVRVPAVDVATHRPMAYAYILTHEGYPSVYWGDYFDIDHHNILKNLLEIRKTYAKGDLSVLHTDEDLYIAQRNGDPGLILGLNDNQTEWKPL